MRRLLAPAAIALVLALTACTPTHSSPIQAEPTPTATQPAPQATVEPAPASDAIPRCASDDYNDGSVPLCYIVRVTDGAVLVIDDSDTVVSVGEDDEAPAPAVEPAPAV